MMLDYYELISLFYDTKFANELRNARDTDELLDMLEIKINELEEEKDKRELKKEQIAFAVVINFLERFETVICNYKTKKNYDRALNMTKGARVLKLKTGKKAIRNLVLIIGGTAILTTAGLTLENMETVEVDTYPGDTIASICEEYDIKPINLKMKKININDTNVDKNGHVSAYVDKDKEDFIEDVNEKRAIEYEENNKTYSFLHVVKHGETYDFLEQTFGAVSITNESGKPLENKSIIQDGMTLKITVKDKDLADEQNEIYNYKNSYVENAPIIEITIKNGDNFIRKVEEFAAENEWIKELSAYQDEDGGFNPALVLNQFDKEYGVIKSPSKYPVGTFSTMAEMTPEEQENLGFNTSRTY